jgi:integrase
MRKVAREALNRAVKLADLATPKPTLHDLRHSHASMLIAMDFSVVDVQRRLGHRKPDTTLRSTRTNGNTARHNEAKPANRSVGSSREGQPRCIKRPAPIAS